MMEEKMYDEILERLKKIEDDYVGKNALLEKIHDSLLGDKFKRQIGYLDQIDINTNDIKELKEQSEELKKKFESQKHPIGKLIAVGAGSATGGSIIAAKWSAIISKISSMFAL